MNEIEKKLKFFALNNLSIEASVQEVEKDFNVDLGHQVDPHRLKDPAYYPQIPYATRMQAAKMAQVYEVFFSLESSIRELIEDRLKDEFGANWWDDSVPEAVRKNSEKNREREIKEGVSLRSNRLIDYTTFGELGEIVKANWDIFSDSFTDIQAVEKVLARLNMLRAPIAHCGVLSEDEILRLKLTVRDWFRLME